MDPNELPPRATSDTKYRSGRTFRHCDDVAAGDEPSVAKATRARKFVTGGVVLVENECHDVVVAAAVVRVHHPPSVASSADVAPDAGHACGGRGWQGMTQG